MAIIITSKTDVNRVSIISKPHVIDENRSVMQYEGESVIIPPRGGYMRLPVALWKRVLEAPMHDVYVDSSDLAKDPRFAGAILDFVRRNMMTNKLIVIDLIKKQPRGSELGYVGIIVDSH